MQLALDEIPVANIDVRETTRITPHVMRIVVYGSPAPQGSKKFVGTYMGKDGRTHGMMGESSKKVKPWRQDVVAAAVEAREAAGNPDPLDCALSVRMIFTLPKPKSAPKKKRIYAMRKPDVSKLARSTEDALTTALIWADDSRVTEYSLSPKCFPAKIQKRSIRPALSSKFEGFGEIMINASNILIAILIAAVVVDIVQMRVEIRKLSDYKRVTRPKLDPLTIEINCDNTDALAKIEEVTAAANAAVEQFAKIRVSPQ